MIEIWPLIYRFHVSFIRDMERLLSEAMMWPVLIWLTWVVVARATRKRVGQ